MLGRLIEYINAAEVGRKFLKGAAGALYITDSVAIAGYSQATLSVSNVAAQTGAALDPGLYDVWCNEADVYIKLAATANDVTTSTGYVVKAGNVTTLEVNASGYKLGGILAAGSGTLCYHRIR